jgi:hypothetical protein
MAAATPTGGRSVEIIRLSTAEEFLAAIVPADHEIGPPNFTSPHVYRGHADASWELRPAAWRKDGIEKLRPLREQLRSEVEAATNPTVKSTREGLIEERLQTVTEVFAVRQFCDLNNCA